MGKTLKEKTFSGLGWSAVDKLFQQLFVFISGILLARTLGPEVYGLIGVLAVFTGIANLLQESGFTTALIRKKNTEQADYVTVFYTNIAIGLFLYLVLFFLAPFISDYYDKPILTPLARFLFLSFVFNSFSVIQNACLIKEINYKLVAKINLFSVPGSYVVALCLAYFDFGVWALASQVVALSFFRSVCLWRFGRWRPSGSFSILIFKEYFLFGSNLVVGGVMNSFTSNIPQNIIAKQYSLGATGFYNQATRLYNTIADFLAGTIQSVPFTVLSNIEEQSRLKKAVRKFIRTKALIVFPLFMGLALISRPFIISLLGQKWEPAIPILQLLCLGGIFSALDSSNSDILRVKGKSGLILIFEIFRNVLILLVIGLVIVFKWNYLYLVGGFTLVYFLKYLAASFFVNRQIGYTFAELIKDLIPYLGVSLLSIGFGYLLSYILDGVFLLISQVLLVGILYVGILYFTNSVLVREILVEIRNKIPKKNK